MNTTTPAASSPASPGPAPARPGAAKPGSTRRRVLAFAAPAISALVLLWVAVFGGLNLEQPAWADEYHNEVRRAISAIPQQIGDWIGTDDPEVTPSQQRILKPNIIVQRTYRQPGSSRYIRLLVVHCKLASDMNGHYPRICYPNTGWSLDSAEPMSIRLGTTAIPATHYMFSSTRDGRDMVMSNINFFILPAREENLAADMLALERSSRSVAHVGLGAAQVQFMSNQPLNTDEWRPIIERFARAVEGPIDAIVQGANR
ncbi:MAG: exosortase-associated EpsI family protein [Phycisphaerales bacterium]